MKVLIFGADGFIGRGITAEASKRHEVFASTRNENDLKVDLTDGEAVVELLIKIGPDVIVNAAGVVENSERAQLNVTFTQNILVAADKLGKKPRVIICSSAGLYGQVGENDLPVTEKTPLNPVGFYAKAKAQEEEKALKFGLENDISVISARIFNPLGSGMNDRFLITNILNQIRQIKDGTREHIEVSRLDARRDYIDVRDVSTAVVSLFDVDDVSTVYNVGSGVATENGKIVSMLLVAEGLPETTPVKESSPMPEPTVACMADINLLHTATGWLPRYTLEETIQGVVDDRKK